jgi:hypothetical protein
LSVFAGAVMLAVPILYPSPYLAAPVFLGFAFLLDPLNAMMGTESILGDMRERRYGRLINLLLAGLVCGFRVGAVELLGRGQMDLHRPHPSEPAALRHAAARYLGFPPFAVECFVMYVWVRALIWRSAARPVSI